MVMRQRTDPFLAQLDAACRRYVECQSDDGDHGGGWGLREGQEPSIVNTTEVLAILNANGQVGDPVDKAITYLTKAIPMHCARRERGKGRGRNTRFVTFGLLGLTEYEGRLSRLDVAETVRWIVRWLEENRFEGGPRGEQGWPEALAEQETSLFQTAMATLAMCRLRDALARRGALAPLPGEAHANELPDRLDALIQHGVTGLLHHRLPNGAWPRQSFGEKGSPAKTSLAVVALSAATGRLPGSLSSLADDQEYACGDLQGTGGVTTIGAAIAGGRDWLLDNSPRWVRFIEADPDVKGTAWSHLSYALGVRACVRAGADPDDPRMVAARYNIDHSWSASDASWTEPVDGHPLPTVRASYSVVVTQLELRAAYGRLGHTPLQSQLARTAQPSLAAEELRLSSRAPEVLETVDENGEVMRFTLPSRKGALIALLASHEGVPRLVDKEEIATNMNLAIESVPNAVAAANKAVQTATSGQVPKLITAVGRGAGSGYRLAVAKLTHLGRV